MSEELEAWVLDTVSEGGYSFTEISQYFARHNVGITALSSVLQVLFKKGEIEVLTTKDVQDEEIQGVEEQNVALARFVEIVDCESKKTSRHYLKVSQEGKKTLMALGVSLS